MLRIALEQQIVRMSANPHSGCRETDIAKTIDTSNQNPSKNQLNTIDRHAVVYSCDEKMGQTYVHENVANTLAARDYKMPQAVCYGKGASIEQNISPTLLATDYKDPPVPAIDRAAFNQGENAKYDFSVRGGGCRSNNSRKRSGSGLLQDTVGALCASDYKFPQQQQIEQGKVVIEVTENCEYIVRRLTPLECCRLQGFPDGWGEIDPKEDFTDEECDFWREVRQTYDEINGRRKKEYTKEQLLKWYNGLHTDSAEYKMWGNGIALPTALYVMEGIAEALEKEE